MRAHAFPHRLTATRLHAQEFDGCQNDWGVNKWKGLQFRRCYINYQKCRLGCFPSERDYCAGC